MISCDLDIFAHLFVCLVAYSNITADIPDRMSAVFLLIYDFCVKTASLVAARPFRVSLLIWLRHAISAKANCGELALPWQGKLGGGRIICRKGHSTRRGRPEGIWQTMP